MLEASLGASKSFIGGYKCIFFYPKNVFFFFNWIFFAIFGLENHPDPDPYWLKMLDQDPDSVNLDPKHWMFLSRIPDPGSRGLHGQIGTYGTGTNRAAERFSKLSVLVSNQRWTWPMLTIMRSRILIRPEPRSYGSESTTQIFRMSN